jgi:AraC-like DNA-binding protein
LAGSGEDGTRRRGGRVQIVTVQHDSPRGCWTFSQWRPAHLAEAVELIWQSDGTALETEDRHYPTPSVELLVNVSGDRYRLLEPGGSEFFDHTWLAGILAGPTVSVVLGVRLRPAGAYALLARPMREVSGLILDLRDLVGPAARDLADRCRDATSVETRFRAAATWVADRIARARGVTPEVAWSAARIERSGGGVPIAQLRRETGLSKTRLVGTFREQIGVAPKRYARLVRFRRATALLDAVASPLADVAVVAGYYDQAHMNTEFRELSRLTPRQYRAARRPDADTVVLPA